MIEFEDMSLTDRREALWQMREIAQHTMNHERRNWFDGVKCLLTERDMPKSVTHPPAASNIVYFDRESSDLEQLAGMGWGML